MDISSLNDALYAFGPFYVDPLRRLLRRGYEPIALSPKVFDTLLYLVENPHRVLDKHELLTAIWPGRIVEESNLSQTMFTLRKVLNDVGEGNRYIVTSPGRGYRFAAPVLRVSGQGDRPPYAPEIPVCEPAQFSGTAGPGTSADQPSAPSRVRRPLFVAYACAFVILTAAALYATLHRYHTEPAVVRNDVVLADFDNATGDTQFDGVLGRVLEIDLSQSPFLNILSQKQVQEILQKMGRPRDGKLTSLAAQEVCERTPARAVLSGALAAVGSRYIVTLNANDCSTGQSIVEGKAETSSKEGVLKSLDDLTAKMRNGLGESLASIQKFGVPIAKATTSSFDALKAYSLGLDARARGDNPGALPFLKRATELDPAFAMAFLELGTTYYTLHEHLLANTYLQKAFELKDRGSEHEKLEIAALYQLSLGNTNEMIQNYKVWSETYPQDWRPWGNLANLYTDTADYADAIEAGKQALRVGPNNGGSYIVLARAYKRATQFELAKAICAQAVAKGLDGWDIHGLLYEIAFTEDDTAAMAEQVAKEMGNSNEHWMLDYEGNAAAASGKIKEARTLFEHAIAAGQQQGPDSSAVVGLLMVDEIDILADVGFKADARQIALKATGLNDNDYAPMVLAKAGDIERAAVLADALGTLNPADTIINAVEIPAARAAIDLQRNLPMDAITTLQPALPYELRDFEVPSLLGQAYLDTKMPGRAALEYRTILENRGVDGLSILFPLAYLGLARADVQMGDKVASRAEYEKFFAFWKDADPDLPVLKQARQEYSELQTPHD